MKNKYISISISIFIFIFIFDIGDLKAVETKYPKTIQMNPFQLMIENILMLEASDSDKNTLMRTASLQINEINDEKKLKIFFQNGFVFYNQKFIQKSLPKTFYLEFSGGVKSVFTIEKNDFAIISNKKNNCIFFSILNFTKSKILLESECLPEEKGVDFNNLGGAVIFFNENIYLSIGTPENASEKIRNLAQSKSSIFGKILKN